MVVEGEGERERGGRSGLASNYQIYNSSNTRTRGGRLENAQRDLLWQISAWWRWGTWLSWQFASQMTRTAPQALSPNSNSHGACPHTVRPGGGDGGRLGGQKEGGGDVLWLF